MTHFYPELGASAPATALVIGRVCRGGIYVKWAAASHDAVLAIMGAHKLSAKNVEEFVTVKGETKWSATMTPKAYAKMQATGIAATECLLD